MHLFARLRPYLLHRRRGLFLVTPLLFALALAPAFSAWSQEAVRTPEHPGPESALPQKDDSCSSQELKRAPKIAGYKTVCLSPSIPEIQYLKEYWDDIESRHDPEKAYGGKITVLKAPVLQQWRNLVKMYPVLTPEKKLQFINGFYNRWSSVSDLENYGKDEYWSTPEEFLEKGGDCEDYAIAKYFALRHFSWPVDDMWVLLVARKKDKEKHALLMARTKLGLFMLDNLSKPGYLLILEDMYLKSFIPLFALNERGIWMFVEKMDAKDAKKGASDKSSADSLSRKQKTTTSAQPQKGQAKQQ